MSRSPFAISLMPAPGRMLCTENVTASLACLSAVHDHSVAVEFIERRCRVGDCEITYRSMVDVFFSGAATMLRTIRPRVAAPAAFALRHRVRRSSPLIQPTQLPSDVEDSPGFPFRPTEAMAPPPAAVA